ncbi:MAG: hypothetical protein ACKVG7_08625, partial [Flavobacteriales bacterium]
IIENVRNLIASTSIYEKDLEKRINKMESFLNHRPEVERELDSLVCLRENYETRKNFLWLKLTDAETAAATIVSDVILIDSARLDGETSIK